MRSSLGRSAFANRIVSELFSTVIDEGDWRDDAACANHPELDELFFPYVNNEGRGLVMYNEGKKICESCPVREECLRFALETNQRYGLWGGHSPTERKILKSEGLDDAPIVYHSIDKPDIERRVRGLQWCSGCGREHPSDRFVNDKATRCRTAQAEENRRLREERRAS